MRTMGRRLIGQRPDEHPGLRLGEERRFFGCWPAGEHIAIVARQHGGNTAVRKRRVRQGLLQKSLGADRGNDVERRMRLPRGNLAHQRDHPFTHQRPNQGATDDELVFLRLGAQARQRMQQIGIVLQIGEFVRAQRAAQQTAVGRHDVDGQRTRQQRLPALEQNLQHFGVLQQISLVLKVGASGFEHRRKTLKVRLRGAHQKTGAGVERAIENLPLPPPGGNGIDQRQHDEGDEQRPVGAANPALHDGRRRQLRRLTRGKQGQFGLPLHPECQGIG